MCQAVVTVERLSFDYPDGRRALDNVSLTVRENETVGLIGPTGAGKSTLLLHLAGLLPEPPQKSTSAVRIGEWPAISRHLMEIRRTVGLVFQDPDDQLFCTSALADVAFGPRSQGLALPDAKRIALNALASLGIEHLADRPPTKLSFGEKRLVCLAGVLACEPKVLAFDEPTSNLDPRSRRRFMELTRSLAVAKLIATHDLEMVAELCQRVVVLDGGKVVATGTCRDLLTDSALMSLHGLEVPISLRPPVKSQP